MGQILRIILKMMWVHDHQLMKAVQEQNEYRYKVLISKLFVYHSVGSIRFFFLHLLEIVLVEDPFFVYQNSKAFKSPVARIYKDLNQ